MQPRPRSAIVARIGEKRQNIEVYYSHTTSQRNYFFTCPVLAKSRFEELPSGQAKRGMARE